MRVFIVLKKHYLQFFIITLFCLYCFYFRVLFFKGEGRGGRPYKIEGGYFIHKLEDLEGKVFCERDCADFFGPTVTIFSTPFLRVLEFPTALKTTRRAICCVLCGDVSNNLKREIILDFYVRN